MNLTFRPLPYWPYPETPSRPALFKAGWDATLKLLEQEIEALGGSEPIIGLVIDAADLRMDGRLRAEAKVRHPGAELSFEIPGGQRLTFHTDVHRQTSRWVGGGPPRQPWRDNVRAIALGLEALRAVDRYGITSSREQYAGWLQLGTTADPATRGRELVEAAGGNMAEALRRAHPDHGGNAADLAAVQAYRRAIPALAGG